MNTYRWAEAFSGLVATLLAIASLAYLLFGPAYNVTTSTGRNGAGSMLQTLQMHIQPVAIIAFCLLLVAIIGVSVGAVFHCRTQTVLWRNVLVFSVSIMVLFTLIGLLSIGPLIAPSALFAILALYLSYTNGTTRTEEGKI
jgi:hypothetical protein